MSTNVTPTPGSRLQKAPPKLDSLIKLVNLVPPEGELKDLSHLQGQPAQAVHESLDRAIANLPDAFVRHLWQTACASSWVSTAAIKAFLHVPPEKSLPKLRKMLPPELAPHVSDPYYSIVHKAWWEYEHIRQSRENLRWLIECARGVGSSEAQDIFYLRTNLEITLTPWGIVKTWKDRFAEAVDEVDATRIRECEACNRIFWAGRVDATCCSTACSTNMRVQIFRHLSRHGFRPGVKLKPKEQAEKAALIAEFRAQRKGR